MNVRESYSRALEERNSVYVCMRRIGGGGIRYPLLLLLSFPIASKREWDERERGREGGRGEGGREEETGFVFRLAFYDLRANGQAARQMASETHS